MHDQPRVACQQCRGGSMAGTVWAGACATCCAACRCSLCGLAHWMAILWPPRVALALALHSCTPLPSSTMGQYHARQGLGGGFKSRKQARFAHRHSRMLLFRESPSCAVSDHTFSPAFFLVSSTSLLIPFSLLPLPLTFFSFSNDMVGDEEHILLGLSSGRLHLLSWRGQVREGGTGRGGDARRG